MENNGEEDQHDEDVNVNEMLWTDVKQFQHRYLINFPKKLKKDLQVQTELPSPVFDPVQITDLKKHGKLFKCIPKQDTRLEFCRKIYSKSNHHLLKKNIGEKSYIEVPQYVVDVALGAFDSYGDPTWHYTGGTLDWFSFNDSMYIARSDSKHTIQVTGMDTSDMSVILEFDDHSPVYSLKSRCNDKDIFIALRQKRKISLFRLPCNSDTLEAQLAWKVKTVNFSFIDTAFNEFNNKEISVIDNIHNLKIKNFETNRDVISYNFPSESSVLSDCLAQIDYLDCNTIGFMNRRCIYLFDLRSLSVQKASFPMSWLKCDDLCTFLKSSKHLHSICVSSAHNVAKFDTRSLKFSNKIAHMLSTPPFLSSMTTDINGEYVCLFGEDTNDKVLLYNCANSLNIPQYVPSVRDTLIATSLTRKISQSEYLEERLSLPILGMKLCNEEKSGDITLLTSNSAGDVFKQKLSQTASACTSPVDRLAEWIYMLPHTPKTLEATSICNMSNTMHAISSRFPDEKKLINVMKDDKAQELFEKNVAVLTQQFQGGVWEAMNAIWDDDKVVTDDSGVSSSLSPKHKVSEWLDSVL